MQTHSIPQCKDFISFIGVVLIAADPAKEHTHGIVTFRLYIES
jgi:hypothetical protein